LLNRRLIVLLTGLCLVGLLIGCAMPAATPPAPTAPPSLPGTAAPTAPPSALDALFGPLDTWEALAPGLERRLYRPDAANSLTQMIALRIDPAQYAFRAHYRPGQPLTAQQWSEQLPDAVAIINANFFTRENTVLGLLVTDGAVHGQTYIDQGGMFSVQGGTPRLQALTTQPYDGSPLEQAVQAFPNLVIAGSPAPITAPGDRVTRRSVIGQDAGGNIILMATPFLGLELIPLAAYLASTDMNFTNAFNLDGGGSTLMVAEVDGTAQVLVTSLDAVPIVLAVYRR
jgi:uncharacterized protein YigE (DUF2233 family)